MRAPPLRKRAVGSAVATLVVALLVVNVFVFAMLRQSLDGALDELLRSRVQIAQSLVGDRSPQQLADDLESLGIPAYVVTAEGTRLLARPASLRSSLTPPSPDGQLVPPIVELRAALPGGGEVVALATRAGVDATLERLLLFQVLGSLGMVVGGALLLRLVIDRTLRPIDTVVATAGRIAEGRTGERLHPERADTEIGRLAVAFDEMIETQEQALDQARAAEELSRTFLADASHQLRTPLAGIRASAELLLRGPSPEERDELLARIVRETARSGRLLNSLLRMARLDQGEPLHRRDTDVLEFVRAEAERARSMSPDLEVELHRVEPLPERVPVDGLAIIEALANLLDNARRHAAQRVDITVSADDDDVHIEISDDGPGVPAEDRERIFGRFVTVGPHGGSGLGLPVARGVAQAHGGDLVYVDGTFVLSLPRRSSSPGQDAGPTTERGSRVTP